MNRSRVHDMRVLMQLAELVQRTPAHLFQAAQPDGLLQGGLRIRMVTGPDGCTDRMWFETEDAKELV